jgi:glycosyltransferase involved in cell wall biosynthesis
MKIALVTDAWHPQVNGVVITLVELVRELARAGHDIEVIEPGQFRTRPCPGYRGIDLAIAPKAGLTATLDAFQPDAIHLATEGPLGWAGRSYCMKRRLAFTTAFHTKFPEIANAAARVPVSWGYALFRHFHRPSSGVMVPSASVLRMLERRGFRNLRAWTHGVDTSLFEYQALPQPYHVTGLLPRPVALFVGRVSYEKNIEAFLKMDFPGSKVVCGVGPVEAQLKRRFPEVHWLGLLRRAELAKVYAAADLFVFPSHADTFGLVMVEAMSTGTPVAAYPVDGPLEVLGRRDEHGRSVGGVMHDDLQQACFAALAVPRRDARARALDFSWTQAAELFESHLVSARPTDGRTGTQPARFATCAEAAGQGQE